MSSAANWRWPAWVAANLAFLLLLALGTAMNAGNEARGLYLCLLFAMCSLPIVLLREINGRYAILSAMLALYLLFFGGGDISAAIGGSGPPVARNPPLLTRAELIILIGVAALLLGHRLGLAATRPREPENPPPDWRPIAVVSMGLLLWAAGTAAVYYWQIHIVVRRSVEIDNDLGAWNTMGLMLGRMIQPLGIMILAYALAKYRSSSLAVLVGAVVVLQISIGFLADSKETAMRAGLIAIIVLTLVRGRLPRAWLGAAALFVLFAFPVFQAYRAEVSGARGYTNEKAAANLGKVLKIAIASSDKVTEGVGGKQYRAQSFIERTSMKSSIEIVAERAGKDVRFQAGDTIVPMFAAFIPRIIWPDKPDAAAGQVFNQEFGISQYRDVYISPSHLGELYWNFGWPGVLLGMLAIGALLGWIGGRCDLSEHATVTRLLVVAVTIYSLVVRFEGSIAVEYTVWIRSLAAVGILHLVFARSTRSRRTSSGVRILDDAAGRAADREAMIGGRTT